MPTVTWDSNTFEAAPADVDQAKYGANKIRELKVAIRERLELEMNFANGTQPLLKAGIASVIYTGNTTDIGTLSTMSNGALAHDTEANSIKKYYDGSWVNISIDHAKLANCANGDDHTQYLHTNKVGQTIYSNVAVDTGVTIDGVDISAHAGSNLRTAHCGGLFGEWDLSTYVAGELYTAQTDGVVVFSANSITQIYVRTPANGPNVSHFAFSSSTTATVVCPVRKGDTWVAYISPSNNANVLRWIPMGC